MTEATIVLGCTIGGLLTTLAFNNHHVRTYKLLESYKVWFK